MKYDISRVATTLIGGWPHVVLDRDSLAALMVKDCLHGRILREKVQPKLAFSMNGQALSLTKTNPIFCGAMKMADYIQADGQSLVFASKFCAGPSLPERIATTDFFHDAAKAAQDSELRFYFLGTTNEQLNKAVRKVKSMYPKLQIAGYRNGYFAQEDELQICQEIVNAGTDVLWVGLGKPKEQLFCTRNQNRLAGVAWIKTCGGLFDFLSDANKRAPNWMQKVGLEWLHRASSNPGRLAWRYLTTNAVAIWCITTFIVKERFSFLYRGRNSLE